MASLVRLLAVIVSGAVAFTGLAVIGLSAPAASAVADRDCGDFGTQQQSQDFFIKHGGPRKDPHRLDADGDGRACESLPCPCAHRKPKPPAGGTGDHGGGKAVIRQKAEVTKVVDGDTVRVRMLRGRAIKDVRLVGIDTPEVYGGTECWGPQASAALKRVLPVGTRVRMASDRSQDRSDGYGRLLRYLSKGKLNVNRQQVFNGSARVYVYDNKPFAQVKAFRSAQAKAKQADRGLWGACR